MPKFFHSLYVQVIIAIIAGVLLGYFYPSAGAALKPLGDGFIKLIKMIIAPVIFITVTTGIASVSDLKKVGRIAVKAFIYFIVFSTLALLTGLMISHLLQPGAGLNINPHSLQSPEISQYVSAARHNSLTDFVMDIIPTTLLSPLSGENILQVLFVSILFGVAIALTGEKSKGVLAFFQSLSTPVFKIVSILMKVAPIGAFGAMAFTIGKYGIDTLKNLAFLVGTFYITAFLFIAVILGAVARYNGFSIFKFIRYIKEEMLLVLGTSSSEPALPSLMQKLENAGCSNSVVGLVVPLGYSFNLDGTNIYMTLAAMFIAQACNIHLTAGQEITLLLVAILSSKGAAGVTGGGFITLAATLAVVPSIPIEGMALILGVDKFMSECRALTNVVGNGVASVVVARWENQLDEKKLIDAMDHKKDISQGMAKLPPQT